MSDDKKDDIAFQGWLSKQGGFQGGWENWKRRWIVIEESTCTLKYYNNELRETLLGLVPLKSGEIFDPLGEAQKRGAIDPRFLERISAEAKSPSSDNDSSQECAACGTVFTLLNSARTCRNCSQSVCDKCSSQRAPLPHLGVSEQVRVCDPCVAAMKLPKWDDKFNKCARCASEFTMFFRKHHCRNCGDTVCGDCSNQTMALPHFGFNDEVRVCTKCYKFLNQRPNSEPNRGAPLPPIERRASVIAGPTAKISIPTDKKQALLFALRTSGRDLWLCADSMIIKQQWINALDEVMSRALSGPAPDPLEEWEIDYSQIQLLEKAGDGAFGEVFRGRLWGTEVAVKTVKGDITPEALSDLKKEIAILSQLRHPNVVLYLGCCTKPPNVCIVTEWCDKGSVFDLIHTKNVIMNTSRMLQIALDAAQGMTYLHSQERRIIHRDLKADNLFCNKHGVVKVGDFGLSHVRDGIKSDKSHNRTLAPAQSPIARGSPVPSSTPSKMPSEKGEFGILGTPQWMAPEVLEGVAYNSKIDVYSFGVLLCEIVARTLPFADRYNIESYRDIVEAVLEDGAIPTIPAWCDSTFRPIILRCLDRDPSRRPTFTEIVRLLRQLGEKSESEWFETQDLPRLAYMLSAPERARQEQAATEIGHFATNTRKSCLQCGNEPQIAFSQAERACQSGFLMRLAALLTSSSERVQLSVCRALNNLLTMPEVRSRVAEKAQVCTPASVQALLGMTLNSKASAELAPLAKAILVELVSDAQLTDKVFMSLDVDRSRRLAKLLATDLLALEEKIKEESATLTRRRDGLLSYVGRLNAFDAKISGILTEYDVKEVIARGLYSTFQVCVHRESSKQLILKTTPLPESFDEAQFAEEFKSLSALSQHPNLIKLLAFHLPPKSGRVQFLLEQTTCGNVIEFAAARAMCSERFAARVAVQMMEALAHLHAAGVLYRVCKPENVLIASEDLESVGAIKLGDFGFSSLLGARDALSEQNGLLLNFCSVAPEVLKSQSHEQASDIFSVGVLIFVLVAGFPPFCGAEKRSGKLMNVPFWPTPLRTSIDALSFPSPHFDAVSAPCRDFLAQLLRVAPAERMSAKQALAHPFLQKAASASNAVSPYANASIKEFLKLWRQRLSR